MTTPAARRQRREYDRVRRRRLHGVNARIYLPVLRRRQDGLCPLCSNPLPTVSREIHVDHILPVADGGSSRPHNLQAVHEACNLRKASGTGEDPLKSIKATPAAPNDAVIVDQIIDRIFKRDRVDLTDKRLLEHFEGHAHRVMETTVNTISNFTGLSVNIPDHVARRIVAKGGTDLLSMDIVGQTRRSLFAGLAESRAQGLHPSSAATRRLVQQHVTAGRFTRMVDRYGKPNGHIYRAKLIARTETMYAQNESALATYEASDAVAQGEIVDDQMGHGDAACMARNGFIGSLDEVRRHVAQEHPNGTARVLPVLKEYVAEMPVVPEAMPEPARVRSLVDERAGPRAPIRPPDPMGRQEFSDLPDYVNEAEHAGMQAYTDLGTKYENYNAALRSGNPLDEVQQRISSSFADLGKHNDSLAGRRLFRGEVRATDFKLDVGDVVTNAAPTSSSVNYEIANVFTRAGEGQRRVFWEIHNVEKGKAVVTNLTEREVILNPGSNLRVVQVHKNIRAGTKVFDDYIVAVVV